MREEVEQLRSKITELEAKIGKLESENQVLRERVAPEVLANLGALCVEKHCLREAPEHKDDEY